MSKRKVVVFSGAGLSAESGIPTFRASDGLWENHKVEDVATPGGWRRDQNLVLEFYRQRFESVRKAEPNAAHKAIASLEEKFDVVNITQNVDDLLERAGCTQIRHLHGSLLSRKCMWHKSACMLDGDLNYTCDYQTTHEQAVAPGDKCPKCGAQMRPDVVWFEEPVAFDFEWVREQVRQVKYENGVFICVGTSAQVHPAASLIPLFAQVKNKFIIDPNARTIADYTLIKGKAGEEMPGLVSRLLAGEI